MPENPLSWCHVTLSPGRRGPAPSAWTLSLLLALWSHTLFCSSSTYLLNLCVHVTYYNWGHKILCKSQAVFCQVNEVNWDSEGFQSALEAGQGRRQDMLALCSRVVWRGKAGKEEGGKRRNREEEGGSETSAFWQQQAIASAPLSVEVRSYTISKWLKIIRGLCSDRKILKIWIALYIASVASCYKVLIPQVAISLEKGRRSLMLCEDFDDWYWLYEPLCLSLDLMRIVQRELYRIWRETLQSSTHPVKTERICNTKCLQQFW